MQDFNAINGELMLAGVDGFDHQSYENLLNEKPVATPEINVSAPYMTVLKHLYEIATRTFSCNVMIAGGAVRDTLLGKPLSDIDIFVEDNNPDANNIKAFCTNTIGEVSFEERTTVDKQDYGFVVIDLNADKSKRDFGAKIQIVFVPNLSTHLDTFSIGLSKVYIDSRGLTLSNEFLKDVKNKTLTTTPNTQKQYLEKISSKYSDYSIMWSKDKV